MRNWLFALLLLPNLACLKIPFSVEFAVDPIPVDDFMKTIDDNIETSLSGLVLAIPDCVKPLKSHIFKNKWIFPEKLPCEIADYGPKDCPEISAETVFGGILANYQIVEIIPVDSEPPTTECQKRFQNIDKTTVDRVVVIFHADSLQFENRFGTIYVLTRDLTEKETESLPNPALFDKLVATGALLKAGTLNAPAEGSNEASIELDSENQTAALAKILTGKFTLALKIDKNPIKRIQTDNECYYQRPKGKLDFSLRVDGRLTVRLGDYECANESLYSPKMRN